MTKDVLICAIWFQCLIFICESLERAEDANIADRIFLGISKQKDSLESVLMGTTLDEDVLKRMEGECL